MQKNICLYRHGVDNDIIDVHKKKLRNREDREKNCVRPIEKIDDHISR